MHVNILTHGMLVNIGPITSYMYTILWPCSCILEKFDYVILIYFFGSLSVFVCFLISVYPHPILIPFFFSEPDPVFAKNIETEMGDEFFHLFPSVFIPNNNANEINEMAFMLWDIIASCESNHIWQIENETWVDYFGLVSIWLALLE